MNDSCAFNRSSRPIPPWMITTAPVRPSNVVRVEMGRVDGAILAPLVARLRSSDGNADATVPPDLRPWFERYGDEHPLLVNMGRRYFVRAIREPTDDGGLLPMSSIDTGAVARSSRMTESATFARSASQADLGPMR